MDLKSLSLDLPHPEVWIWQLGALLSAWVLWDVCCPHARGSFLTHFNIFIQLDPHCLT